MGRNTQVLKPGETAEAQRFSEKAAATEWEAKLYIDNSLEEPVDGGQVVARLCRNDSGGALLPKRGVKFAASSTCKVTSYSGSSEPVEGVVDPHLPSAGVANGEWFAVHVKGKTRGVSSAAIADAAKLESAANGKLVTLASFGETYSGLSVDVASGADEDHLFVLSPVKAS